MKVKSWDPSVGHRRPTLKFTDGFEVERVCWDPKDGARLIYLKKLQPITFILHPSSYLTSWLTALAKAARTAREAVVARVAVQLALINNENP